MAENNKNTKQEEKKAEAAKPEKEKKDKPAEKKPGLFSRIGKWMRELKSELKKVQWPTGKQTANNTVIVIVCVIIVGIFIWSFDALATAVIKALLGLVGK